MKVLKFLFFGNFFYGFCAIAMMLETCSVLKIQHSPILFLLLVHMAVVWFYTKAYIQQNQHSPVNERTIWYLQNRKQILNTQMGFTIVIPIFAVVLLPNVFQGLQKVTITQWLLLSIPMVLALGYYGISEKINLRRLLIFKPVAIALVWSFTASILPVLYSQLQNEKQLHLSKQILEWALQNFWFVLCLAIMFDIKDYEADANAPIKTFVTKFGLSHTVNKIVIPLCVFTTIVFYFFVDRNFSLHSYPWLNFIPYLLLIGVGLSLLKPKKIFYYLVVIDGLMFAKALISILSFKYLF